jgi:hypothetical protein
LWAKPKKKTLKEKDKNGLFLFYINTYNYVNILKIDYETDILVIKLINHLKYEIFV